MGPRLDDPSETWFWVDDQDVGGLPGGMERQERQVGEVLLLLGGEAVRVE